VVSVVSATPPALSATAGQAGTATVAHGPGSGGGAGSGWGTGRLTDADLRALVSQMTLSEEAGMVHGEGDPPSSAAANASCAASAVAASGRPGGFPAWPGWGFRRCA